MSGNWNKTAEILMGAADKAAAAGDMAACITLSRAAADCLEIARRLKRLDENAPNE